MSKILLSVFLSLFAVDSFSLEDGFILKEYRIKGRNKFVGKEIVTVRTFCIDGYKFVSSGTSFIQFYENQDGLPMPAKCDTN